MIKLDNGDSGRSGTSIRFEMISANGHPFEVVTCGEGHRLALCLHGFPEHALSWRNQMPLLAGLGYRVWAPNQRGYGKSYRPQGVSKYRVERLIEDVAGLIDASGAKETVLIAHDWGAVVAWIFAARQIRPLDALIIMNVPHPQCYMERLFRSSQIFRSWYIYFFQLPRIPEWFLTLRHAAMVERAVLRSSSKPQEFPRDLLQVFRDNASQPGAMTAMLNWYRALLRGGSAIRQLRQKFPVIITRTLMIWGEDDVALSKATTYDTHRYVSDLTLRYLPGVSHWVQQDATEAVNAMMKSFLLGEAVPMAQV